MGGQVADLRSLLDAIREATQDGQVERATALEWEYSELLGAQMLAEDSGVESSTPPGSDSRSGSWSWSEVASTTGHCSPGLSEPGSAETAQDTVGASAAHALLREAVGGLRAGPARAHPADGTRLFLWPIARGLAPRMWTVAPLPSVPRVIGQLFLEVV